jgi:hypothetical protein
LKVIDGEMKKIFESSTFFALIIGTIFALLIGFFKVIWKNYPAESILIFYGSIYTAYLTKEVIRKKIETKNRNID